MVSLIGHSLSQHLGTANLDNKIWFIQTYLLTMQLYCLYLEVSSEHPSLPFLPNLNDLLAILTTLMYHDKYALISPGSQYKVVHLLLTSGLQCPSGHKSQALLFFGVLRLLDLLLHPQLSPNLEYTLKGQYILHKSPGLFVSSQMDILYQGTLPYFLPVFHRLFCLSRGSLSL